MEIKIVKRDRAKGFLGDLLDNMDNQTLSRAEDRLAKQNRVMTEKERQVVENAAIKLAKEYCNPSDEVIDVTRQMIYDYLLAAFIAGAEFAIDRLDKDLAKQIEEAISTTLVVQNKQSIHIAVDKIIKLLQVYPRE